MPGRLSDWATNYLLWINRMNKKELDIFKRHVKTWRDRLGNRDWEVCAEMDEIESDRTAQCQFDCQNRCSLVTIDSTIEKPSSKNLEAAAVHEMLELSLADIRELMCRFYSWEFVDGVIHKHIRRMENALK